MEVSCRLIVGKKNPSQNKQSFWRWEPQMMKPYRYSVMAYESGITLEHWALTFLGQPPPPPRFLRRKALVCRFAPGYFDELTYYLPWIMLLWFDIEQLSLSRTDLHLPG